VSINKLDAIIKSYVGKVVEKRGDQTVVRFVDMQDAADAELEAKSAGVPVLSRNGSLITFLNAVPGEIVYRQPPYAVEKRGNRFIVLTPGGAENPEKFTSLEAAKKAIQQFINPYMNGRAKAEAYLNQKMANAGVRLENISGGDLAGMVQRLLSKQWELVSAKEQAYAQKDYKKADMIQKEIERNMQEVDVAKKRLEKGHGGDILSRILK